MLIVQPIGGLCNRIRSVNSALSLAAERRDSLIVVWFLNRELNCPFEKLFSPNPDIKIINIRSKWDIRKIYYQLTCQFISNPAIYPYRIPIGQTEPISAKAAAFFQSFRNRCYIATEESFYPMRDYSFFSPTPEIAARLAVLTKDFTPHTLGVHIRRTDHIPARESSSTASFVTAMQKRLKEHPRTNFYLATDDLEEEKYLRSLFGSKIISNETRRLDRNSIAGIQDALIDLLALSRTQEIIGSYFSSFTDMAADMGGIPKEIAGK